VIAPADLRALGYTLCGCGSTGKRTSRPWICGPGCVPNAGRGGATQAQQSASRKTGLRRGGEPFDSAAPAVSAVAHPSPSTDKYRIRAICEDAGLPVPVLEYRFAPPRRWRFDAAWIDAKVALEVDGAIWRNGRHTRGSGWVKDTEKLNEAACRGWRLLRLQPKQVKDELAALVRRAVDGTR
jgi:hypothetical protein